MVDIDFPRHADGPFVIHVTRKISRKRGLWCRMRPIKPVNRSSTRQLLLAASMKFKSPQSWNEVVEIVGILIALVLSTVTFYQTSWVNENLLMTVAGEVDKRLPREQIDQINIEIAVVNTGNRWAAVLPQGEGLLLYGKSDKRLHAWVACLTPAVE